MTTALPTIEEFLKSLSLEQYHERFIESGANENDLNIMVQFNDQELSEFTSSLDMLPFHSVTFKNGIRKLKDNLAPTIPDTTTPSELDIVSFQATIYGRHQSRPLTNYEKAINDAAIHLALQDPLLLSKKGDLFKKAKKKLLDDGFVYKRGKSRSKLTDEAPQPSLQRQLSLPKRRENAERMSLERQDKISFLEKKVEEILRIRQFAENDLEAGSYDASDERQTMKAKIVEYEDKKRELTRQISKLRAQERKHKWYYKRKSVKQNEQSNSGSQIEDDELDSRASLSFDSNEEEDEEEEDKSFSVYSVETTLCMRESDVRETNLNKNIP